MKVDHVKLATSNTGKLREYQRLAPNSPIVLELMTEFASTPKFDEAAPTFAENAAGKAIHYSQFTVGVVLAEDSGLVVPALDGRPGVHSARYAGEKATDVDRNRKLLEEMRGLSGEQRRARFVCVSALAERGRALAVVSDFVEGLIAREPRGTDGFGYDPIFFVPDLAKTFGEATPEEKDRLSHRGKAFRKMLAAIEEHDFPARAAARQ
jgi:non-canonical purine NTP pyrophosphatase (RdgB/HAM1 family)